MEAEALVRDYFDAARRRDVDAMAAHYAPDAVWKIAGVTEAAGPAAIRAFWDELFAAMPDWTFEVLRTVAEGDAVVVHWRATATFAGAPLRGLEPTGARIDITGLDLVQVRDGKLARNDAYLDGLTQARQLGLLPDADSAGEARLASVFNLRTRAVRKLAAADPERVADGVWRVRGGTPRVMNVYLLEEPDGGVTAFDAGVRQMAGAIGAAAAELGGLRRVVLGHAHADHRGSAALLRVPVLCHVDERADVEGDGGMRYADVSKLKPPTRWALPRLMESWDGGPVAVAETLQEGDEVAGFRVVHLPGHAPGQIALVRDRDRLALTTDVFYVVDVGTGRPLPPHPPESAFSLDDDQARAAILRLASLDLAAAWPGHGEALRGDVRGQLERTV